MRRIVFLIGAAALLAPSAVIGYQPTIHSLEPQTASPAMATTPPTQPAEEAIIVSVTVTPTPTPTPSPTPSPTPPPAARTARVEPSRVELMKAAGIAQADWEYAEWIIEKESGWQHTVWNSQGSGAYGLCQALPAEKMASAGADYMTNPVTQLKWCDSYAKERYGGWKDAFLAWGYQGW